jgi:hypothetical protein
MDQSFVFGIGNLAAAVILNLGRRKRRKRQERNSTLCMPWSKRREGAMGAGRRDIIYEIVSKNKEEGGTVEDLAADAAGPDTAEGEVGEGTQTPLQGDGDDK